MWGWVGPTAGLEGCEKSRPHRDSSHAPSNPQRVAIPTEVSRPTMLLLIFQGVHLPAGHFTNSSHFYREDGGSTFPPKTIITRLHGVISLDTTTWIFSAVSVLNVWDESGSEGTVCFCTAERLFVSHADYTCRLLTAEGSNDAAFAKCRCQR